jgi:hypothetical protein
MQRLRKGFSFALGDGGLGAQQIRGEFYPGWGGRAVHRAAENKCISAVESDARRVLEILASGIDHSEIESWF